MKYDVNDNWDRHCDDRKDWDGCGCDKMDKKKPCFLDEKKCLVNFPFKVEVRIKPCDDSPRKKFR